MPTAPWPTSRAGSAAHRNTISQSPGPRQGPDPDPDPTHATVPTDIPRSVDPGGQTPEEAQLAGGAAAPPALPPQPQRGEPTVDATEDVGGPPQRTEAPPTAVDLPA